MAGLAVGGHFTMPKKGTTKAPKAPPVAPHNPIVEAPAVPPYEGDRVAILEPTATVPYRVLPPEDPKAASKAQKDAEARAKKDADARAKAQVEADKLATKDKASRAVLVRATAKGFYPHDGRIRNPGEEFTYYRHQDPKTGKLEDSLPTWMVHVDGNLPTRAFGELSGHDEQVFAQSAKPPAVPGTSPLASPSSVI